MTKDFMTLAFALRHRSKRGDLIEILKIAKGLPGMKRVCKNTMLQMRASFFTNRVISPQIRLSDPVGKSNSAGEFEDSMGAC